GAAASAAEAPGVLNIRLGEARMAAQGGRAPVLSPDGERLLFARRPNSDWFDEWWLAGADGSGARLLFRSARDAAWSPEGDRIIFNRAPGKLVIYDLARKREFEVFEGERRDVAAPRWTADGKALVYQSSDVPYLLELEYLTSREIRTDWRLAQGVSGEVDQPAVFEPDTPQGLRFTCTAENGPHSRQVAYTDGSLPKLGDPHGGAFAGLWAASEDGRLAVRLYPRPCLQMSVRPGRVAFAGPDGVRVAAISARQAPWNSRFVTRFGAAQGAEVGQHLVVYSKRVNPLNGQVVGLEEGDVKGGLEIVAVRAEEALAELVEWTGKPLKPDDVAAGEFERVNNVFAEGRRAPARWSVIGAPLSAAQLDAWGGEAGVAAGIQKAVDVRRARELVVRGTQHYHSGDMEQAFADLSEAHTLDTENQVARNNLGAVRIKRAMDYFHAGERERAVAEFQAACALGVEDACRNAEIAGKR
ncbi:MAG: hypothetical protein FD126_2656, partial [Elusimicrobia bacterium]